MTDHDRYLDLAAASIDFPLAGEEAAELERHLASCPHCRRTAYVMRDDARILAELPIVPIAPLRAERIQRRVLRGTTSRIAPSRLFAVAAVLTLSSVAALSLGSRLFDRDSTDPSPRPSATPGTTEGPRPSRSDLVVGPSPSALPTPPTPSDAPGPSASPRPPDPPGVSRDVSLPVAGEIVDPSGRGLGSRLVAGDDGVLHVAIAGDRGMTLALFDRGDDGMPLPGWPLLLEGLQACSDLVPAGDGSVRIVCQLPGDPATRGIVHAFGRDGLALPGWPVEVEGDLRLWEQRRQPRVVDGTTWIMPGIVLAEELVPNESWVTGIHPDGSVDVGRKVEHECCLAVPALGPDGRGYVVEFTGGGVTDSSRVTAFSLRGVDPGWPVNIPDLSSPPSFDAQGRIHLALGGLGDGPTRTVVLDRDGRDLGLGSDNLEIVSSGHWVGAGAEPAPPVVAIDGTTYIVETDTGTRVVGVDPSGAVKPGWPYESNLPVQPLGSCGNGADTGCGYWLTTQATGPDGTLYVLHAAANDGRGGSIVAIGRDGRVRDGWPVTLTRAGSEFHAVTVGRDGTIWALADEPEAGGRSASILAIAPNSTVLFTATVVEP